MLCKDKAATGAALTALSEARGRYRNNPHRPHSAKVCHTIETELGIHATGQQHGHLGPSQRAALETHRQGGHLVAVWPVCRCIHPLTCTRAAHTHHTAVHAACKNALLVLAAAECEHLGSVLVNAREQHRRGPVPQLHMTAVVARDDSMVACHQQRPNMCV